jgi:hypothetical protein
VRKYIFHFGFIRHLGSLSLVSFSRRLDQNLDLQGTGGDIVFLSRNKLNKKGLILKVHPGPAGHRWR